MNPYLTPAARDQATQTVKAIESQTAAEIVVCVHGISGHYRHIDLAFGGVLALATLGYLMFSEHDFSEWTTLAGVAMVFAFGATVCHLIGPLRRSLASRKLIAEHVGTHARSAFVELGVSKTSHRTGILVFVSLFERKVQLVPDAGVNVKAIAVWPQLEAELGRELPRGPDGFFATLKKLGPELARVLPRSEDDVNELPDEPQIA